VHSNRPVKVLNVHSRKSTLKIRKTGRIICARWFLSLLFKPIFFCPISRFDSTYIMFCLNSDFLELLLSTYNIQDLQIPDNYGTAQYEYLVEIKNFCFSNYIITNTNTKQVVILNTYMVNYTVYDFIGL